MRRIGIFLAAASVVALSGVPAAGADASRARVRGPHCGGKFINAEECSFRYRGGQLYLSGSVRGNGIPSGAATIRLETRNRTTGTRYLLLACATPSSGACAAAGSVDVEELKRGQKLICTVEGHGRGDFECGTLIKRR